MISSLWSFVISLVVLSVCKLFGLPWWLDLTIGAVIFLLLWLYLGWLARKWGAKGFVWGILEYNKLIFKERFGILTDVYVSPTEDLMSYITAWKESVKTGKEVSYEIKMEDDTIRKGKVLVTNATYKVHIMDKSGLLLLGLPWVYKIRALPWSRYDDPKEVRHSIRLGDYSLEVGSQHKGVGPEDKRDTLLPVYDEHGIPDYITADQIRVASSLTLIIRARKYVLFGYKLQYPKDLFLDLVLGVWREEVLAKHRLFTEVLLGKLLGKVDTEEMDITSYAVSPEISQRGSRYCGVGRRGKAKRRRYRH
jgi:hypothetical protein